jgi:hypothetical protein
MGTLTNNNIRSFNVSVRFFTLANAELLLNHLDFSIEEMATEGVDSLCGSDSDDPYTVHNYFEVKFNGTQLDTSLLDDFIANIIAKQNNTGENQATVMAQITTQSAVTTNYAFTGVTRKPFSMSASGRSDPFKYSSGFKCKKMVKT